MPIMMEKLYDALRGVAGEDKARAAAVEAAEFRNDIANLESTLRLHTWILSANTAGIVILLGLALRG